MDFVLLSDNLLQELKKIEAAYFEELKKSNMSIILCRDLLCKFKKNIAINEFSSKEDEIEFFKATKQIPLSNLIYHSEIHSFKMQLPRGCKIVQRKFIDKKLKKLNRFFTYNLDFVKYIELEQTHLDEYFFTRACQDNQTIVHTQAYFYDPLFSTSHDLLLGKLIAYKRFITYLEGFSVERQNLTFTKGNTLQWTSTKAALTELVYALYHNNVFNNGSADIKNIAETLQQSFNFELGDFYKVYSEIKIRKKSRTKFLDELSIGLTSEMNKSEI